MVLLFIQVSSDAHVSVNLQVCAFEGSHDFEFSVSFDLVTIAS